MFMREVLRQEQLGPALAVRLHVGDELRLHADHRLDGGDLRLAVGLMTRAL
jgi:hypothetical protein